jgi:hypothetical protein
MTKKYVEDKKIEAEAGNSVLFITTYRHVGGGAL